MLRPFALSFHVPGTLTANITFIWTAPFDCTLRSISAVATSATNATIEAGTTTDPNGFLVASAVGPSSVPATYDRDDFLGALMSGGEARLSAGDVFNIPVDFDGDAGTAAANLTVVAILEEG
jgi:hypothetical protein